ncbi:MAG: fructokinase [Actinomycetota bacterium]|nr:fructokinase [Actinomycetota bacterium]
MAHRHAVSGGDFLKVVSAGYMPIDVIVPYNAVPSRAVGGTAANVPLILAHFGWEASLAGQTGDDLLADEYEGEVRAAGASTSLLRRAAGAETARLLHRVDADGHSYGYTCPRCHQRFPRSRPLTLELARVVADSEPNPVVYFFDRVNAATVWLAEHYADTGAVVAFEPSLATGGELFRRACEAASLIKHSKEFDLPIPKTPPRSRPEQVSVITDGAAGLSYRIGTSPEKHLPAIPTLAVDTAGAGDWITASLLAATCSANGLDKQYVDEGLRRGQALAAMCCTLVGARALSGVPIRMLNRRIDEVLASNYVDAPPKVTARPATEPRPGRCATCLLAT